MCASVLIVLSLFIFGSLIDGSQGSVEWKNYSKIEIYENAIQIDALPFNESIYVGQVHVSDNISEAHLPANIIIGENYTRVTLNKKLLFIFEDIKILVSNNKEKFGWKGTNKDNFYKHFDQNEYVPFQVGWEYNSVEKFNASIYLGKALIPALGGHFIGKVYKGHPDENRNGRLWIDFPADEYPYWLNKGNFELAVLYK
ncbi:uncharacterized protein [Diabrotica undecimpunctata]|uniref:uncharacterized protein n=1 Tax=Diabrotica undecimpunctata TaxID=50387 RepID=UPI003B63780C